MKRGIESVRFLHSRTAHEHSRLTDDLEAQQIFERELLVSQRVEGRPVLVHGEHVPIDQNRIGILVKYFDGGAHCAGQVVIIRVEPGDIYLPESQHPIDLAPGEIIKAALSAVPAKFPVSSIKLSTDVVQIFVDQPDLTAANLKEISKIVGEQILSPVETQIAGPLTSRKLVELFRARFPQLLEKPRLRRPSR